MERSTHHGTFVIERNYPAAPARVFAAWTSPEAKARWNVCHDDWRVVEHQLDFRVGGREVQRTGPPGGPMHVFEGRFIDIVPDQRIVYAYEMRVDDTRVSVSLATVEVHAEGRRTRLVFTEQVVFLDGHGDLEEREEGTRVGFDRLAIALG